MVRSQSGDVKRADFHGRARDTGHSRCPRAGRAISRRANEVTYQLRIGRHGRARAALFPRVFSGNTQRGPRNRLRAAGSRL